MELHRTCRLLRSLRIFRSYGSSVVNVGAPRRSRLAVEQKKKQTTGPEAFLQRFLETYPDLSDMDKKIMTTNFFVNKRQSERMLTKRLSPRGAQKYFENEANISYCVYSDQFLAFILLPIEEGKDYFIKSLKKSPAEFIPHYFNFCGNLMRGIDKAGRRMLIQRLYKAVESNGIKFDIKMINSWLKARLENDDHFEPWEMLRLAENDMKLEVDQDFFDCLVWQIAKSGEIHMFDSLHLEMSKRGFGPSIETKLAEIFASECCGVTLKSDGLLNKFQIQHPEMRHQAMAVACEGATCRRDYDRLRVLLRKSVEMAKDGKVYDLSLPQQKIFDVVFSLAENSVDGMGKECSTLVQQVLSHTRREHGFHQRLAAEAESHLDNGFFFTAIALLGQSRRSVATKQFKYPNFVDFFQRLSADFLHKLADKMIEKRLEEDVIIDISNRVLSLLGPETDFYTVLMTKLIQKSEITWFYRFELFKRVVDIVDSERERPHLMMPFVASATSVFEKLSIIYRMKLMGYNNLFEVDNDFLVRHIVIPDLKYKVYSDLSATDKTRLNYMYTSLKSFGITDREILKLAKVAKRVSRSEPIFVSPMNLTSWIEEKEQNLPVDDAADFIPSPEMTTDQLKHLIDEENVEKLHLALVRNGGFPENTDFSQVTEPLLVLYLEQANFGYVQKLLQMLSQAAEPDSHSEVENSPKNPHNFVENYHLLHILHRKLTELGVNNDLEVLIEYVYELRRMFPYATADSSTAFQTVGAYRNLFKALMQEKTLTKDVLDKITDFLDVLVRLNYINLHTNETISPYIMRRVIRILGWNTAVDTWLKLQQTFHLSNGMLELLKEVLSKNPVDSHRKNFVLQRAKTYLSESRINAFLAIAYVQIQKYEEAENVLRQNKVRPMDLAQLFRLNNSLQTATLGQDADTTYEFLKICLNSTELGKDKDALRVCHADWIKVCERNNLGVHAIRIKELLDHYNVELDREYLNRVQALAEEHNRLVDKWILNPQTNVLNSSLLTGSEVLKQINEFKQKSNINDGMEQLKMTSVVT
ncbi:unnamed protein product [Bursaphelenchus xylophilus]|uniref:(pine wood nematode) hypothetical protein n=1 Tax=Bursaphelenchus xylophilus TaxID=6326 RepID=A0A1I7RTA8_BURXY|nr:unnamed protein product [Bursaphelenchus xylophilus]CAG9122518.1 unnamed protein product [Bursaphelenchus xylophilus]